MWIGTLLSGALLVQHERSHRKGDKQAESEVTPSLNLLWYRITRFMSRSGLYPPILSLDLLVGELGKPQIAVSWLTIPSGCGCVEDMFLKLSRRQNETLTGLKIHDRAPAVFHANYTSCIALYLRENVQCWGANVLVYWHKTFLQKSLHHFGEVLLVKTK